MQIRIISSAILAVLSFSSFTLADCEPNWKPGNGLSAGLSNEPIVQGFTIYNDELVAIGIFRTADDVEVNGIASWNGNNWQGFGSGLSNGYQYSPGYALTVYNGDLIAGGGFTRIGGIDANGAAKWDGDEWQALGRGLTSGPSFTRVRSLTIYNGELIAGGDFNLADGTEANKIAAWNGEQWRSLGSGFRIGNGQNYGVRALTVFNGELIAGGDFNNAGGVDVNGIAKWNGLSWEPLGGGVSGVRFYIEALIPFDGKLIAAGSFSKAGGADVNNIAAWDGSAWQPLDTGFQGWVYALTIYNGQLIAGGNFFNAAGAFSIARWDGTTWQPLGNGITGRNADVAALTSFKGDLIVGGWFATAGGLPSMYWARWGVPQPIEGDLNHDCVVDLYDVSLLVDRWLDEDCMYNGWCYEADMNYDFKVDFDDFSNIAANWLAGE